MQKRDYRLTPQFRLYPFLKRQIAKVSPNKVHNAKALSAEEREAVISLVQKKYNLSREQLNAYFDLNLSCPDTLKLFLDMNGELESYDWIQTKQSALDTRRSYCIASLITTSIIALFVVIAVIINSLISYIILGSCALLVLPFFVLYAYRFFRTNAFIRSKLAPAVQHTHGVIIQKVAFDFSFVGRHDRAYSLLSIKVRGIVGGERKTFIYYCGFSPVFKRTHFFSFVRVVKELKKAFLGKTIALDVFEGTNIVASPSGNVEKKLTSVSRSVYSK